MRAIHFLIPLALISLAGVCDAQSSIPPQTSNPRMVRLPSLQGASGVSYPYGISADGTTVVGGASSPNTSNTEAFKWTEQAGMIGLGDLPGGSFNSFAIGSSADGSVVTGLGDLTIHSGAFRWTQSGGITQLAMANGYNGGAIGHAVSNNGSTIVGNMGSLTKTQACRWVNGIPSALPFINAADSTAEGRGVSADGSMVVGFESKPNGQNIAFRWTTAGGYQLLNDIPSGGGSTQAIGVSGDGNYVLGTAVGPGGIEPVRWNSAGVPQRLGLLPNGAYAKAIAKASSADGSVVVGNIIGGGAFIWDQTHGYRNLSVALSDDYGLTDDYFYTVGSISADGLAIAGANAANRGIVVYLPEPTSGLATVTLIALLVRRHRTVGKLARPETCSQSISAKAL